MVASSACQIEGTRMREPITIKLAGNGKDQVDPVSKIIVPFFALTTARMPPGRSSFAKVTRRWMTRMTSSRMEPTVPSPPMRSRLHRTEGFPILRIRHAQGISAHRHVRTGFRPAPGLPKVDSTCTARDKAVTVRRSLRVATPTFNHDVKSLFRHARDLIQHKPRRVMNKDASVTRVFVEVRKPIAELAA